jgi:hypothetical protein
VKEKEKGKERRKGKGLTEQAKSHDVKIYNEYRLFMSVISCYSSTVRKYGYIGIIEDIKYVDIIRLFTIYIFYAQKIG